jgi:hypothetical protein
MCFSGKPIIERMTISLSPLLVYFLRPRTYCLSDTDQFLRKATCYIYGFR